MESTNYLICKSGIEPDKFDMPEMLSEKKMEGLGKNIYANHDFYRSLTNLLENPEFKILFKDYFGSWKDIELFVMFLKLYEKIGDQFPDFNGYQKIYLVKSLIENANSRKVICAELRNSRLALCDVPRIKARRTSLADLEISRICKSA